MLLQCGLSKEELGDDAWQHIHELLTKKQKQQQEEDETNKTKNEKPQVLLHASGAKLTQAHKAKEQASKFILQLAAETDKLNTKLQEALAKLPAAEEKLQLAIRQVDEAEEYHAKCIAATTQRRPPEASQQGSSYWKQQYTEVALKLKEIEANIQKEEKEAAKGMEVEPVEPTLDSVPAAADGSAGQLQPPQPAQTPEPAAAGAASSGLKTGTVEQLAQTFGGAGRFLSRIQEQAAATERRDRERSPKRGPGAAGHADEDPVESPDNDKDEFANLFENEHGEDSKSDFASAAGSVTSTIVAAAAKRVAQSAAEGERAKQKLQKAAAKAAGKSRG